MSSEQALGDGEGQGSPACCSPWGHKELDMTERLSTHCYQNFTDRAIGTEKLRDYPRSHTSKC